MNERDRKAAIMAARKNPQPAIRNKIKPLARVAVQNPTLPVVKPEPKEPLLAKVVRAGAWSDFRCPGSTWKSLVIQGQVCWLVTSGFEDDVELTMNCYDDMEDDDWWLTEDDEPEVLDVTHFFKQVPFDTAMELLRRDGHVTLR